MHERRIACRLCVAVFLLSLLTMPARMVAQSSATQTDTFLLATLSTGYNGPVIFIGDNEPATSPDGGPLFLCGSYSFNYKAKIVFVGSTPCTDQSCRGEVQYAFTDKIFPIGSRGTNLTYMISCAPWNIYEVTVTYVPPPQ